MARSTYHGNKENKFSIISRFIAIHNYESEQLGFGKLSGKSLKLLDQTRNSRPEFEINKYLSDSRLEVKLSNCLIDRLSNIWVHQNDFERTLLDNQKPQTSEFRQLYKLKNTLWSLFDDLTFAYLPTVP